MGSILLMPQGVNAGDVSDGHHTFQELYDHRHALFCLLINSLRFEKFKTSYTKEGESWDGWFIAGIVLPTGLITYHLPLQYWGWVNAPERDTCDLYDGHTSKDVIQRLMDYSTDLCADQ